MPVTNPVQSANWSSPGAIGATTPNTGKFTNLDVTDPSSSTFPVRFAGNNQYFARAVISHPGSPGIGLFHGSTWAWSFFSDSYLLGNGNSFCITNEATGKMNFAIDGNTAKVQVFGGLRVDEETPALTFTSPASPGAGNMAVSGFVQFGNRTLATVPSPTGRTGATIYVSDEAGGGTLAFSDGTNWRRVQDRAVIS